MQPCPVRIARRRSTMSAAFPARRQAGPERDAGRPGRGSNGSTTSASPTWPTRASWSASAPAGTAARRCAARSPRRTSSPSRRPSATTARRRASTGRSTWARTRTRCPGRPSARRSRSWPPTASRPSSSATTASRRRRSSRAPSCVHNRGRTDHLADGIVITPSHNPPEDGGFKYNPPNGGPADTDVTRWIEERANELLRERQRRREARAVRRGAQGGDDAPGRLRRCRTSTTCATSSTWTPSAPPG